MVPFKKIAILDFNRVLPIADHRQPADWRHAQRRAFILHASDLGADAIYFRVKSSNQVSPSYHAALQLAREAMAISKTIFCLLPGMLLPSDCNQVPASKKTHSAIAGLQFSDYRPELIREYQDWKPWQDSEYLHYASLLETRSLGNLRQEASGEEPPVLDANIQEAPAEESNIQKPPIGQPPMREALLSKEALSARLEYFGTRRNRYYGCSCHSIESLQKAEALGYDYAFFSPVFSTQSHPEATPLGLDQLAAGCAAVSIPVFALGGINLENEQSCLDAGAHGIAGISLFL